MAILNYLTTKDLKRMIKEKTFKGETHQQLIQELKERQINDNN